MDIKQLRYFFEVANQRSFSKASQNLHVSQPNISRMVKNLEDELGFMLLDRASNQIQLTDAGHIVLGEALRVIQIMENLSTKLADLMNVQTGTIRMGLPPTIGSKYFPKIMSQFHERYPKIKIQFVEYGSKTIELEVGEGHLDIGVVVLPVDEDQFHSTPIIHEEVQLLLHRDHPLMKKTMVSFQDLSEESFILYRQDFTLHGRIIEECIRAGFEPNIIYESSQWDFIRGMVGTNLGISLLPKSICEEAVTEEILTLPISPKIPWNVSIIWRKNQYLSYAAREWIQFACSHFENN